MAAHAALDTGTPQLGYIPVRAERGTKGKVDIVMELKSYQTL
jgi:hypothetical protein